MMTRRDALAVPLASLATAGLYPPLIGTAQSADAADPTKVFTGGKKPTDARLGPAKTYNGYFPFVPPKTKEEWDARRKVAREEVLVATGLWPMPQKTPLNPVIHGKIEQDGYTIEKVYFASLPGHYVSGNLYRPTTPGKHPAVLCPHGHFPGGRLGESSDKDAAAMMKQGAEATREGAKSSLQARCATLARLGFVVFHYDMVGYADSQAIPHREGFKDAAAELRQQSFMGLQTWNSIRSLDFLESLPDVDPKRIGVTGASGGGTQTFILCAIDDRPAAAFPAVMVSTAMQGGCVCENCSYLRVDTGNIELAGLTAPRPLAMSAAQDWTKEILTKGFPELKALYTLLGVPDNVAAKAWPQFSHGYNQPSREFMYNWFNKHLQGKDTDIKEPPFRFVPPKELSVYDEKHPRPKDELDAAKLREVMTKASDAQMAALFPKDATAFKEFRRVIGTALRVMVDDALPQKVAVRNEPAETKVDDLTLHLAALGRVDEPDSVPTAGLVGPKGVASLVIWVHPRGKASLLENGKIAPAAKTLIDAGYGILAPDVLGIGELAFEKPYTVNKEYSGYTFGYNRPLLANRVHDVLTSIAFGKTLLKAKTIHLIGWGELGPVTVLAKALAGDAVTKTAADLNQFRFETITDASDPMMLPGAVKYGGLPAFLALCAPGAVLAHNHTGTATGTLSKAAYAAAGAPDKLTRSGDKLADLKVIEWLVKE